MVCYRRVVTLISLQVCHYLTVPLITTKTAVKAPLSDASASHEPLDRGTHGKFRFATSSCIPVSAHAWSP